MDEKPETPFVTRTLDAFEELLRLSEINSVSDQVMLETERQEKYFLKGIRCPRCGSLVAPFYPVPVFCDDCKKEFREYDRAVTNGRWFSECLESRKATTHEK